MRNFRNFEHLGLQLDPSVTYVLGENNSGKTNLLSALRLATDVSLPGSHRSLAWADLHSGTDFTVPDQVVVSVEFADIASTVESQALTAHWMLDDDRARLHYRFRPRPAVRAEIENEEREPEALHLSDYAWEMTGGGAEDPATVAWDDELGSRTSLQDLQPYWVTTLPAIARR